MTAAISISIITAPRVIGLISALAFSSFTIKDSDSFFTTSSFFVQ